MTPNSYVLSFRNIHCTSTTGHSILSAGGQQWQGEQTSRPLVGFTQIKQQTCLYQAGVNIPTSQRQNRDAKSRLSTHGRVRILVQASLPGDLCIVSMAKITTSACQASVRSQLVATGSNFRVGTLPRLFLSHPRLPLYLPVAVP